MMIVGKQHESVTFDICDYVQYVLRVWSLKCEVFNVEQL